jgi:magnesium transporter
MINNKKIGETVSKIADVPKNIIKQLNPVKKKKKSSMKIGMPPGSMIYVGEQKVEKVKITLTEYDAEGIESCEINSVEEVEPYTDTPKVTWVNVCGLHETEFLKQIGEKFNIHPLVLEDILNTETRPKLEITDDYIFIVMKLVCYNSDLKMLETEQASFILGKNFVFSFLEKSENVFNPLRERISNQTGRLRKSGCDFLFYALMDIIVDNYYLVLEKTDEEIDSLDEALINNSEEIQIREIHNLKRQLIALRRNTWPLRELFSLLIRDDSKLIKKSTGPYLRDLLDHTIHVTESVDSFRETANTLMETYLSMASNKMNEVMKVLTVIATIFIPLTFIVGIYGMNFNYMPELQWPWAYFAVWGVMIAVFVVMLIYFRKKKWF